MVFSPTLFIFLKGIVLETTGTIEEKKQDLVQSETKKDLATPVYKLNIRNNKTILNQTSNKISINVDTCVSFLTTPKKTCVMTRMSKK